MATPPLIARRELLAIDKKGNEFNITLAIGLPYEGSDGGWSCPVALDGLYSSLPDLQGVDSWQALQLAYQITVNLLGGFVREGGRLLWPEIRQPIEMAELFPQMV